MCYMIISGLERHSSVYAYIIGSMWAQDEIESADRLIDFFEKAVGILDMALNCSHKARHSSKRASHTFTQWSKLIGQTARVRAKLVDPKWQGQSIESVRMQRERITQQNIEASNSVRNEVFCDLAAPDTKREKKQSNGQNNQHPTTGNSNSVPAPNKNPPLLHPQQLQRKRKLVRDVSSSTKNPAGPVAAPTVTPANANVRATALAASSARVPPQGKGLKPRIAPRPSIVQKKDTRTSRAPFKSTIINASKKSHPRQSYLPAKRQTIRPWQMPVHVRPPKTLYRNPARRLSKLSSIPE